MESVTDPAMLKDRAFYRLGEFTYDNRKAIIVFGVLICIGLSSLSLMGPDWAESFGEGNMESTRAIELKNDAFALDESGYRTFTYLVHHETLNDSDIVWRESVEVALADFAERDDVEIVYSWELSAEERVSAVSLEENGYWALNEVRIDGDQKQAKIVYQEIKDTISIGDGFEGWRTKDIAVHATFDTRISDDLVKAEIVSGPITLIILLIVFGTVVAALLPFSMGVMTVLPAIGVTIWLSNVADVNQYAINIISLIGIGVSIDYSLFLVNRFREELSRGRDIRTATAMSVATAGKAVFFSGVTVAIGLMGMLFFTNTSMPSLGIGGTLAVSIAMVYSTIVLPALLASIGPNINRWKSPIRMSLDSDNGGYWGSIARFVMKHPIAVLVPTLIILLGAGMPFLQAEFALSSVEALPPDDESRQGIDHIDSIWPRGAENIALVVIDLDGGDPFSEHNLGIFHSQMLEYISDEDVVSAFGIGLPQQGMNQSEVVSFWGTPDEYLTNETISQRNYLRGQFVSDDLTYIVVSLEGSQTSTESRGQIIDMRLENPDIAEQLESGENTQVLIGGFAAYNQDTLETIEENLPKALAFIIIMTMLLIYIQVRSIIIPIKAVAMNILSVSASFGMMVWVFQWGNGAELLNFTPQPIDSGNPVILFCIVFGLSMDYEVLMLSRIHEEWERTGDNTLAVAKGLERTGRLITGAAAIMVVVFGAFGLSSVIILKQIGFGLALAILIDATIVRALVVPATMRLMGKWNWWSPSWLPGSKNTKQVEESEE
jgi:RND superfamily putative drug exporter